MAPSAISAISTPTKAPALCTDAAGGTHGDAAGATARSAAASGVAASGAAASGAAALDADPSYISAHGRMVATTLGDPSSTHLGELSTKRARKQDARGNPAFEPAIMTIEPQVPIDYLPHKCARPIGTRRTRVCAVIPRSHSAGLW